MDPKINAQLFEHDLLRFAIFILYKARAQRFMPANHIVQTALQQSDVQLTFKPQTRGKVISHSAGLQLFQEPQPLLSIGKPSFLFRRTRTDWDSGQISATAQGFVDGTRETFQPWAFEDHGPRNFTDEIFSTPHHTLGGQQGLSAQYSTIV